MTLRGMKNVTEKIRGMIFFFEKNKGYEKNTNIWKKYSVSGINNDHPLKRCGHEK